MKGVNFGSSVSKIRTLYIAGSPVNTYSHFSCESNVYMLNTHTLTHTHTQTHTPHTHTHKALAEQRQLFSISL